MSEPVRGLLKKGQDDVHARIPRRVSRRLLDHVSKRVVVGFLYNNVEDSIWVSLVTANRS